MRGNFSFQIDLFKGIIVVSQCTLVTKSLYSDLKHSWLIRLHLIE